MNLLFRKIYIPLINSNRFMKLDDYTRISELCSDHGCEELTKKGRVYVASFSPEHRLLSSDLEEAIEKEWEKEIAKDRASGREPLNNKFVRVLSHERVNGDIGLNLGLTDWKHYNGAKKINSPELIWGIGTAGFTYFINQKTGERTYVFATRDTTKVTDIGGKLETPPAGYLDPTMLTNRSLGESFLFYKDFEREFEEEIGLPKDRIVSSDLINLIRIPRTHDYSVDFSLEVKTTAEELQEGFKKGKKYGGEHSGHFLVPEHELSSFVEKYSQIMPPRTKCDIKNYLLAHSEITEH